MDTTALRYFARIGDTRRLEAELARLRALYPNWTPPTDLRAAPPVADPQLDRMWQLYAQGQFGEARKVIADRMQAESGWMPPADLLDRLRVAESRERLINASDAKQYETVVRIAAATPSLLTCSEVDVLWRVGEAFARTKRPARARDDYQYILKNCDKPEERLATMQKAASLLPRADLDALFALERRDPGGAGEFDPVRGDLARASVAAAGKDATLTATASDLAILEGLARTGAAANDPLLLGWYYLVHAEPEKAEQWFRLSRDRQNAAEPSEGLALALVALKRPNDAEAVAYEWRKASDNLRKVYLAAVANLLAEEPPADISQERLARMIAVVAEAHDPAAGQQIGWYARALGQQETAAQWFTTVLSWKPDDEPSAYGLALARQSLGERDAFLAIVRAWSSRSARIAQLLNPVRPKSAPEVAGSPPAAPSAPAPLPPELVVEPRAGAPPQADAYLPARSRLRRGCTTEAPVASLPADLALARGWCLMQLNRPAEAAVAFDRALASAASRTREDAAYGLSLANLRLGLTSRAAVAATEAPMSGSRVTELNAAILAQRATSAFDAGRYVEALLALDQRSRVASEPLDLMTMRGWSYYHLGRWSDAQQVFSAAAAAGYRDAAKGLATVESAMNPRLH
ncbi:MAG: cellulose synthase [Methylobacteriaceae bacterium]|nr:cellulose synthase [Methylobacteriaceae bacterium]